MFTDSEVLINNSYQFNYSPRAVQTKLLGKRENGCQRLALDNRLVLLFSGNFFPKECQVPLTADLLETTSLQCI